MYISFVTNKYSISLYICYVIFVVMTAEKFLVLGLQLSLKLL